MHLASLTVVFGTLTRWPKNKNLAIPIIPRAVTKNKNCNVLCTVLAGAETTRQ